MWVVPDCSKFTGMARGHTLVLGNDHLAALVGQVKTPTSPRRRSGTKAICAPLSIKRKLSLTKKFSRMVSLFRPMAFQQDRDRHLATAVDAEIQQIFGIEFEVEPGSAVGNDARREQ